MPDALKLTVLVENTAADDELMPEHGFSCWLEHGATRLLFDTGQGSALPGNAAALGIDLASADAIVLSHGHYDHAGGLPYVRELARPATLYMHPAAVEQRYSFRNGQFHPNGMPASAVHATNGAVECQTAVTVAPGIMVTGEIPRVNDFEDAGTFFFYENHHYPDPVIDDQALVIESAAGTIVLLGCAHAGVLNTLDYVSRLTGRQNIHALIGGMHLAHADADRLRRTVDAIAAHDVRVLAPGHCTGEAALGVLREAFPEQFRPCRTGSRFAFA